jgi:Cu(I)/Ag(I) efflux system membrane fusion protein
VFVTPDGPVAYRDTGKGVERIKLQLGRRSVSAIEVVTGLAAGDRVVTQGAFLLDAETRLNPAAAAAYFGAEMKK